MLAQRAIDKLGHLGLGVLLGVAMSYAAVDIRHLKTFDAIVRDVGNKVHVVNIELALLFSLGKDLAEKLHLSTVETLAHLLHHPDVTEEFGTEVSVTNDRLTNHGQMRVDQLDDLLNRCLPST